MPAKPLNKRLTPSRQNGATNNVLTSGPNLGNLSDAALGRLQAGASQSLKVGGLQVQGSPIGLQIDVGREVLRRSRASIGIK